MGVQWPPCKMFGAVSNCRKHIRLHDKGCLKLPFKRRQIIDDNINSIWNWLRFDVDKMRNRTSSWPTKKKKTFQISKRKLWKCHYSFHYSCNCLEKGVGWRLHRFLLALSIALTKHCCHKNCTVHLRLKNTLNAQTPLKIAFRKQCRAPFMQFASFSVEDPSNIFN